MGGFEEAVKLAENFYLYEDFKTHRGKINSRNKTGERCKTRFQRSSKSEGSRNHNSLKINAVKNEDQPFLNGYGFEQQNFIKVKCLFFI